ncbi:hypothetical protein KKF91_00690 [Myxococcota bacterium]|nr:hypothetical protein [Myxococcota bacterium]MBU1429051.1 hypothetical protein [Myxococcota bacterium]MBU1896558.1 hypothetical protein [Myxococcota bacterium]
MKIAVVSGPYQQGLSYQENIWPEILTGMGHQIRVFYAAPTAAPPRPIECAEGIYEIQAIESLILPRQIYYERGLGGAVLAFAPDLIFWGAVATYFGRDLVRDPRLGAIPTASFFSENVGGMHAFDWTAPGLRLKDRLHALAYHALRGADTVLGCLRSQIVVANTPETAEILLYYPRGARRRAIKRKIIQLPLGFSPRDFAYQPARRASARAALALPPEARLCVYSSRFAPNKEAAIQVSIEALEAAMDASNAIYGLLIGFDDGPVSDRARQRLISSRHAARFRLRPFADRVGLSALYHASDVAFFARPSISCQEALGTGLYTLLADDGSMDHLIHGADQGGFFRRDDAQDMARALEAALERLGDEAARARRAEAARWLGYDRICQRVIDALGAAKAG